MPGKSKAITDSELSTLLEQYRICVEMADKNAERRQVANTFFLALNTAVVGMIGALQALQTFPITSKLSWIIAAAGISVSFAWRRYIDSYQKLAEAKFKVIHKMEALLPHKPFTEEWDLLGQGKSHKSYRPFTVIEAAIPVIFIVLNALALIVSIPWSFLQHLIGA